MTLSETMLRSDVMRYAGDRTELAVYLPWHRSLPLACVEAIAVLIDGAPATGADPKVRLVGPNREPLALSRTSSVSATWDLRDPLLVELDVDPLEPESAHEIDVTVAVRIPYISIAPGEPLVQATRAVKTVTARKASS